MAWRDAGVPAARFPSAVRWEQECGGVGLLFVHHVNIDGSRADNVIRWRSNRLFVPRPLWR